MGIKSPFQVKNNYRNCAGLISTINLHRYSMTRYICLLTMMITVYSCKKDCSMTIENMKLLPVVESENGEPSQIQGWYYSEFQDKAIHLSLEFDHYGAGEFCNYYWQNYPEVSSIKIYCNKDIYTNNDIFKAGEELKECFKIQTFENDFYIRFLVSEKTGLNIRLAESFCTFSASIITNKNELLADSCIVKR